MTTVRPDGDGLTAAEFGRIVGQAATHAVRCGAELGALTDQMAENYRQFAEGGVGRVLAWIEEQSANPPAPATFAEIEDDTTGTIAHLEDLMLRTTAPMSKQSRPEAKSRDRDAVYAAIETRAFAERQPGQSDARAIADYITRNPGAHSDYLNAPLPAEPRRATEPVRDRRASDLIYDELERLALSERKPGETIARAVTRFCGTEAGGAMYRRYADALMAGK